MPAFVLIFGGLVAALSSRRREVAAAAIWTNGLRGGVCQSQSGGGVRPLRVWPISSQTGA